MKVSVSDLSGIFKALSDETRLKILYLLNKKPLCVCEIMGALNITQTKTSRHLIYMKNAGLLDASKEDRWALYRIRENLPEGVRTLLNKAIELMKDTGELVEIEENLDSILENESLYRQTFLLKGETCPSPSATKPQAAS